MFVYCKSVSMVANPTDVSPIQRPPGSDPDRWRRVRLGELAAHIHATTAELVLLLGEVDSSGGWQGIGLRSVGHWASIDLGVAARVAQAQARAGQRLKELPSIAAAALAGELGWDKISLLTQVAEPDSEAHWLHLAREMSVGQLARLVSAYRQASADTRDGLEETRRRRGMWLLTEPDGLVRLTGLLEPDDAAVVRAALAAHLELLWHTPDPSDDPAHDPDATAGTVGASGDTPPATETPSGMVAPRDPGPGLAATASEVDPSQGAYEPIATRRLDALVSVMRTALAQPGLPDPSDDTTRVTLCVDEALLTGAAGTGRCHYTDGDGSIPVSTARRICCDSVIQPLVTRNEQAIDLGRTTRTPSAPSAARSATATTTRAPSPAATQPTGSTPTTSSTGPMAARRRWRTSPCSAATTTASTTKAATRSPATMAEPASTDPTAHPSPHPGHLRLAAPRPGDRHSPPPRPPPVAAAPPTGRSTTHSTPSSTSREGARTRGPGEPGDLPDLGPGRPGHRVGMSMFRVPEPPSRPSTRASEPWSDPRSARRPLIAGFICAALGFVVHLSSSSSQTVNGVVRDCSYFDLAPWLFGPATLACVIVALRRAGRAGAAGTRVRVLGAACVALGVLHLLRALQIIDVMSGSPC
jgi:hypothetical protein